MIKNSDKNIKKESFSPTNEKRKESQESYEYKYNKKNLKKKYL